MILRPAGTWAGRMKNIVLLPAIFSSRTGRCLVMPWVQRPHSLARERVQVLESGPRRRESIVLGFPVVGLNILPAIEGSCWTDRARRSGAGTRR